MVISGPSPEDLRLMSNGAKMASALPYIESEIGRMVSLTKTQALKHLADNTLTPEMALSAWREIASYERLLKRLQTHVKVGISAADRVDPQPIGDE